MSILQLNKVTILARTENKEALLGGLQKRGCMHLISLQPTHKEPEKAPTEHAEDVYQALRYLLDMRNKRHQVSDESKFDLNAVVAQTLANKQRLRDVGDRRDFLVQRIADLEPWGHFELPPEGIADYCFWFYIIPHTKMKDLQNLEIPWQVVHKDNRQSYVVVIAKEEPPASALPAVRTHTGSVSLKQLRRQLDQCIVELEEVEAERQSLSRWIYLLTKNFNHAEDLAALRFAESQILNQGDLCVLQGWVPQRDLNIIKDFVENAGFAMVTEEPKDDDEPPTFMHNPESLSGAQDLVSFYQTPGYSSWDPSQIVFYSFALFFAMILADAGYSIILGLVIAYFWKRMGASPAGLRFRRLSIAVLSTSFVYGMLVGSYFGISPKEDSLLGQLNILTLEDFDTMMRLSIFIGCAHIAIANIAIITKARTISERAKPLGWIAVIYGGLGIWFSKSGIGPVWQENASTILMVIGFGLIVLFASQRKATSFKAILLRIVDGLIALTNFTKLFGDILSYLRLFALGLASSSLAVTFNQLADQVREGVPGLGLLLAILVLLLGHGINLGLGIISGFVHGLRLNFIEFFNWGVAEEGYPFCAFAKKEKENE